MIDATAIAAWTRRNRETARAYEFDKRRAAGLCAWCDAPAVSGDGNPWTCMQHMWKGAPR